MTNSNESSFGTILPCKCTHYGNKLDTAFIKLSEDRDALEREGAGSHLLDALDFAIASLDEVRTAMVATKNTRTLEMAQARGAKKTSVERENAFRKVSILTAREASRAASGKTIEIWTGPTFEAAIAGRLDTPADGPSGPSVLHPHAPSLARESQDSRVESFLHSRTEGQIIARGREGQLLLRDGTMMKPQHE